MANLVGFRERGGGTDGDGEIQRFERYGRDRWRYGEIQRWRDMGGIDGDMGR